MKFWIELNFEIFEFFYEIRILTYSLCPYDSHQSGQLQRHVSEKDRARRQTQIITDEWNSVCSRCDLLFTSVYIFVNTTISVYIILYYTPWVKEHA
jgi:hypothetical protein